MPEGGDCHEVIENSNNTISYENENNHKNYEENDDGGEKNNDELKKKKKKKKSKSKGNSGPVIQTDPPTVSIAELFPSGITPKFFSILI